MPNNPVFLLVVSALISAIPIAIWLYIFSKSEKGGKKTLLLVFTLGCFTAPAMLGIQLLWQKYPSLNLLNFIETFFKSPMLVIIGVTLLFVVLEEVIKLYVIKTIDKKTLLINKINDAMRYGIAAALGFSFGENIYYLFTFWGFIGTGELVGMYIFRSLFTTAAHIMYTGIFGYYYGIGKFAMVINKQKELSGEEDTISKIIAKLFRLPMSEGFRQKVVLKGFSLAVILHFSVNYLLELGQVLPVIAINAVGYLYLQYLLKRKAGRLILLSDPTTRRPSTIASKDREVVVELLGMWFKEKRYVDVLHICERLLERDPDNNVIKLFKSRAMDAMDKKDIYRKVLGTVVKTNENLSIDEKNTISKYVAEKEMFQKVQKKIKEQLKKEGKEFKKTEAPKVDQQQPPKEKEEQDTFKL